MALMKFREPNKVLWRGNRPAHNGEQVYASTSCAAGGSPKTIYTVPVGKMLFVTHAMLFVTSAANGNFYIDWCTGGNVHQGALVGSYAFTYYANLGQSLTFYFPIEVPAGYKIRLVTSAASIWGAFHGFIDDV